MRVLIVEDEVELRSLLLKILKLKFKDYEFLEASEGSEALSIVQDSNVDVIFTDINMPNGMGGQELLENLEKFNYKGSIFVISGFYDNERFKDNPMVQDFHAKPFNIQKIVDSINLCKDKNVG